MANASAAGGGKAIATAVGGGSGGNTTAMANASAAGGGKAIATAVATPGVGPNFGQPTAQAESTAKTDFAGVSVQSNAMITFVSGTGKVEAIAQGGSGQTSVDSAATFYAISTAPPDKAYATTLTDGADNVAEALLGPGDEIFGTSILYGSPVGTSSTFDFRYQGDLLLGVIDGFGFSITVNGTQIFIGAGDFVSDTVIDLGSNFGPNIDLTISGFGTFAFGGAVPQAIPEPSTWAMMPLGFAGLGFAGYRRARLAA